MIKKIITTCIGLMLGLAIFYYWIDCYSNFSNLPQTPPLRLLTTLPTQNAIDHLLGRRANYWRLW